MRKFIGVVILAIFLVGCETQVEEVKTNADSKPATTQPKEEQQEEKIFKVGDTVKVNGFEISITSAKFTKPNQYSETKKGKVLTLEIATANTDANSAFIDNTDFNLYDKDGNKLEQYYGYDELAISGNINKGKKLSGKLFFDVPEDDKYELVYVPFSSFDNKEIKFEIIPQK